MIKDNRIGEGSAKMSDEQKMKLRYMREQRDQARERFEQKDREIEERKDAKSGVHLSTKQTKKRSKFQSLDIFLTTSLNL